MGQFWMQSNTSSQALHTSFKGKAIESLLRCDGQASAISEEDVAKAVKIIGGNGCPHFSSICTEDELHRHLDAAKNQYKTDLRDLMLELYTAINFIRPTTAMTNNYVPYRAPAFSLHGFTTPGELASALGNNSSSNGFVGRFMVFATIERPVKNYSVFADDFNVCVKTLSANHSWAAGLATEQIGSPSSSYLKRGTQAHR